MASSGSARQGRVDGERTRQRILDVARPLFAAHGYAGTSVRMVARAAAVNVATLAYHFKDKQGMYDAVVSGLHEDLAKDFPETLMDGDDPDEMIRTLVRRAWGFVKSHRDPIRLQIRHVLDTGGQPEVVVEVLSEPLLVRAEALVGAFRPAWTQVNRRMLVLSFMHTIVRLSLEDPAQLARMIGGVEDLDSAVTGFLTDWIRRELGLA